MLYILARKFETDVIYIVLSISFVLVARGDKRDLVEPRGVAVSHEIRSYSQTNEYRVV